MSENDDILTVQEKEQARRDNKTKRSLEMTPNEIYQ